MPDTKSVMLCIRCTESFREEVHQTAERFGSSSDVIRDLLQAFVEGRVTVTPDPTKPTLENPHVN